jgi:arylsulfatase A-like enzyme
MTIDVLPTMANILEADMPARSIDGRDALSVLVSEPGATSPQEVYLFYYGRNNLEAIRWGRWKLHLPHTYRSMEGRPGGTGGKPTKYTYGMKQDLALYDVEVDPGETTDVSHANQEVMVKMLELVEAARADLGDNLVKREGRGVREPGRIPEEKKPDQG